MSNVGNEGNLGNEPPGADDSEQSAINHDAQNFECAKESPIDPSLNKEIRTPGNASSHSLPHTSAISSRNGAEDEDVASSSREDQIEYVPTSSDSQLHLNVHVTKPLLQPSAENSERSQHSPSTMRSLSSSTDNSSSGGELGRKNYDMLIHIVQEETDPEELLSALTKIRTLTDEEDFVEYAKEHNFWNHVVKVIEVNIDNLKIQIIACEILTILCQKSDDICKEMQSSTTYRCLIQIIKDHPLNQELQLAGSQLLSDMIDSEEVRNHLLLDEQMSDVEEIVLSLFKNFQSSPNIQCLAFIILRHVLEEDSELHTTFLAYHFTTVRQCLFLYGNNPSLVNSILAVLVLLAENSSNASTLLDYKIDQIATESMAAMRDHEGIVENCCLLLAFLFQNDQMTQLQTSTDLLYETILPVLRRFTSNAIIQEFGLRILCQQAELVGIKVLDHQGMDRDLACYQWCQQIYTAMVKHMDNADIEEMACRGISKLSECKADLSHFIGNGDYKGKEQVPLHSQCLGCLMMYGKERSVFDAACEAIYWMAADNEVISRSLMEKNAYLLILDGIRRHVKDAKTLELAFRATRGLCIFQGHHKNQLVMHGVQSHLNKAIRMYPANAELMLEVVSCIACLADIPFVCNQCFIDKVHIKVMKIMSDFPDNVMLQEAGLECLGVLSSAENASELLNAAGAVDHVCMVLKRCSNVLYIQKKGLMLLQVLVDKSLQNTDDRYGQLAHVIVTAMRNFINEPSVLEEACVTVKIITEVSDDIRGHFVHERCHELLFRILAEQYETNLHDLAAECLVIFGLDDTTKNRMLLTECSKGHILGVECLLNMDAEVNCGEGNDTPICHAVNAQNEEIVKLLLHRGVLDISRALQLAQTLENHVITGHLLGTLVNRRDGFDIPWNSLGLGKSGLNAEWFRIALKSGSTSTVGSPVEPPTIRKQSVGHHIISKVQKVLEEREKRDKSKLPKSQSEPALHMTGQTQVRLRYNLHQSTSQENGKDRGHNAIKESSEIEKSYPSMKLEARGMPFHSTELSPISSPASSIHLKPDEYGGSEEVFGASSSDVQEWKEASLTGANVPYSVYDPRVRKVPKVKRKTGVVGPWRRKDRSPSPSSSNLAQMDQFSTYEDKFSQSELSSDADGESSDYGKFHGKSRHISGDSAVSDTDYESRRSSVTPVLQTPRSLDLSDNGLKELKGLVTALLSLPLYFAYLETLRLEKNSLSELPSSLFNMLPRLIHLDLKNNKFLEFPQETLSCECLKTLELDYNEISTIELKISNSSLQELSVSHNKLTGVPNNISCFLPNLRCLNLNSNGIGEVYPNDPLGLLRLEKLHLSHNNIKELSDAFLCECPKLEYLEIAYNGLESLPHESVAEFLPRLYKLKLRMNKLGRKEPLYLPKFLLDLPSLRSVDISENNLTSLPPPNAWKSPTLKELIALKNSITRLSLDGAKALSKLELLNLAENGIQEIPKEIGQLSSLTSLDISHNKLTTLPDELGKCSKLWEMPLHGLPNLSLDPSLTKGRVKDLIVYLHNKLKKATGFYRMKLMLIGYGGRGKSTLLRALMKNFKNIERNQPTVGVIVKDWKYERQPKDKHGKVTYTLSTWDFAGQEEFYSSHQCYISGRAVYLVVCNIKRGPREIDLLKPWLSTIHARAPGCPVIFVMTHLDQIPDSMREAKVGEMDRKLQETIDKAGFPEIKGSYAVACIRENQTIHDLRTAINEVIEGYTFKGQPVMGQKIPASYVRMAEILENEVKNEVKNKNNSYPVITHGRLVRIVQEQNLDLDKEELQQAVHFLHDSGILLHYPDKTLNLNNLYFIDPGWLCSMMAQVVTVKQINPFIRNGILRKADTFLLFTGKRVDKESSFVFPKGLIPQYLKLLEKFEIALPHSETELLVPCHLSPKRPQLDIPQRQGRDVISRYYRMPYVPLGLWPRLITRVIGFSQSSVTEMLIGQSSMPRLTYWSKGIVMSWGRSLYCLIETPPTPDHDETIQITVPTNRTGISVLCLVIDHVDALIEEWYPGLTTIDPLQGKELLDKLVPCMECSRKGMERYMFSLPDLSKEADKCSIVSCKQCESIIRIADLAPDIMLSDFENDFPLDEMQFVFEESAENLLGDGGFGSVYRAEYNKQAVAVKVFTYVADIDPIKTLRQEATILRCLHHPSVVSLMAVSRRYKAIMIELAPLGSQSMAVRDGKLANREIQHKIALQTAEGLAYLHGLMIVYRDLKPDNVLIFSTSLTAVVNAKVSDYGIARFTTPDGLTAQEGTPGYRAPEVFRGETYSVKADVFSFGVTLYTLVTQGRHPFDNLEYKSEMDRAFADGHSAPPITQKHVSPWPCMQHILASCLQLSPDLRPSSADVIEKLKNPDILGLKRVLPISVGTTVECLTVQEQDNGKVYLWIASGDCENAQLSRLDLMDHNADIKGTMFRYGRIMSLLALSGGYLLIGTQLSKIWLFDSIRYEPIHCTSLLPDAVLCMKHVRLSLPEPDDLIVAGLANGTVCVFLQSDLLHEPNNYPMCIPTGEKHEAVRCMAYVHKWKQLYASCGSRIVVVEVRRPISCDKYLQTLPDGDPRPIYSLVIRKSQLMVCHKGSSIVQVWNLTKRTLSHQWNVNTILQLQGPQCRVTTMCIQKGRGYLWLGTGGGHILVIDESTGKVVATAKKYAGVIRTLEYVKSTGPSKYNAILSGGLGFITEKDEKVDSETECGCVLVWDPEFGEKSKLLADDFCRRQRYVDQFQSNVPVPEDVVTRFEASEPKTAKETFLYKRNINEMFDSL